MFKIQFLWKKEKEKPSRNKEKKTPVVNFEEKIKKKMKLNCALYFQLYQQLNKGEFLFEEINKSLQETNKNWRRKKKIRNKNKIINSRGYIEQSQSVVECKIC